ncbi:hypothetical protein BG015_005317 [Linnemannia schmuckeri]|uniref:Uncharacterized protein n=1 Tax=Linnemannia schmuckeri TaxID=64567 RepID=A0A9P5R6C9_9FUNG|nr:hypothetical protein BG015_005317 [Linnemannia schmuckeri]
MLLHSSSSSLCSQQSAPTSSASPSAANYQKLVATLTSSGQKPYGTIPRRRRNRASSTAAITSTSSTSRSSQSSSRNSLELLPTTTSLPNSTTLPLPHPASSTTTTLWASLKAHYFATAQSFSWPTSSTFKPSSTPANNNNRRSTDCAREFLPPLALLVANSSPVVTLDATPLILTSLEANDISTEEYNNNAEEGLYPASVAAMDKFKVMRSDTIALKTFTYRETPVVEVKRPRTPLLTQRRRPVSIPKPATAVIAATSAAAAASTPVAAPEEELLPLPRHLACRETRSNPDYLRMMASELRMIRARKLIAPLKPRSYLPRRRELFSPVKSSLSVSMEMTCEEDDHPLNNLLVGSWTSFSSAESFLSSTSSSYATADESFD